jgi:tetratricopeptide (TPR) repeat protein
MDLMIRFARPAMAALCLPMVAAAGTFGLAPDRPPPVATKSSDAPIVRAIEIQYAGPPTVTQEQILASMRTAIGQPYSERFTDDDIRGIYNTGGIYNLRIFGQELLDGVKIFVVVQCKPKITEIQIQGATTAMEAALRKELSSRKDDFLDGVALASDKQRIIDYYARTGLGPVDVEDSTDINDKLGAVKVVFSIHDVPEEEPGWDPQRLDPSQKWMLEFLTPAFYEELSEKSKQALLRRIIRLESATLISPENAVAWLQLGAAYVQLGSGYSRTDKPDQAIDALRKAVKLLPEDATAWQGLAACFSKKANLDEALDASERAMKADPLSFDGWIIRGVLLMEMMRLPDARAAFEKATALEPRSIVLSNFFALLHWIEGRPGDVRGAKAMVFKIDASEIEAWAPQTVVLQLGQRFPNLEALWQAGVENHFAHRVLLMGLAYDHLWEDAAGEAKKAVARYPSDDVAWAILGEADLKREHWQEGVDAITKARLLGFDAPESFVELSRGLIELGRLDDAKKILTRLIAALPKSADALALSGVISRQENRLAESDSYSRQALEIAPGNAVALMNLASICLETKQPSEAIGYAQSVPTNDPTKWRAWELIGSARERLGDPDAAADAFNEAAELEPGQSAGWQGIARTSNDYARACNAAQKAAEVDHENDAAQALLGMTQSRFRKNAEAIDSLMSVLVKSPGNDVALSALQDLLIPPASLSRSEAAEILQGVTAECPEWPLGWRMLSEDYLALQRFPDAVDALKKAVSQHGVQTDPGFVGVLADLVKAAVKMEISKALRRPASASKSSTLPSPNPPANAISTTPIPARVLPLRSSGQRPRSGDYILCKNSPGG